jgi:hypothetical protein
LQARCNGGFIIGREAADRRRIPDHHRLVLSARNAAIRDAAARARGPEYALAFDHTLGNSVYGGAGIPIWAHKDVPNA